VAFANACLRERGDAARDRRLVFLSASYNTGAILLRVKARREKICPRMSAVESYATAFNHDGYLYGFDGRQESGARLRCVELKRAESDGPGKLGRAQSRLRTIVARADRSARIDPGPHRRWSSSQQPPLKSCQPPRALPSAGGWSFLRAQQDKLVCVNLARARLSGHDINAMAIVFMFMTLSFKKPAHSFFQFLRA